jgi:hypothetical protein
MSPTPGRRQCFTTNCTYVEPTDMVAKRREMIQPCLDKRTTAMNNYLPSREHSDSCTSVYWYFLWVGFNPNPAYATWRTWPSTQRGDLNCRFDSSQIWTLALKPFEQYRETSNHFIHQQEFSAISTNPFNCNRQGGNRHTCKNRNILLVAHRKITIENFMTGHLHLVLIDI